MIFGQPGSGKGTQADILEEKMGFVHFDSGKFLESIVHDPKNKDNPEIQKEKENFDTGKLITPSFILKFANLETEKLATENKSIVFSGSPRTEYEVLGDEENQGEIFTFEKLYGKENIIPIFIKVSDATSIARNSKRIICIKTGKPVLREEDCDGPVRHRTLDAPEVIKKRLVEYRNRTIPAIETIKARSYKIHEVDGEQNPQAVEKDIAKIISNESR